MRPSRTMVVLGGRLIVCLPDDARNYTAHIVGLTSPTVSSSSVLPAARGPREPGRDGRLGTAVTRPSEGALAVWGSRAPGEAAVPTSSFVGALLGDPWFQAVGCGTSVACSSVR
jgi:hypothetical protein